MIAKHTRFWSIVFTIIPLVLSQNLCPNGTFPLCSLHTGTVCPDGDQPQCVGPVDAIVQPLSCPSACDPLANTCDPITAPTCIFPNPSVASPRGACACRPGYKANGPAGDASKQWRLPIKGQQHRVWVAEGVGCNVLCDVSTGTESCQEVKLLAEECVGTVPGLPSEAISHCQSSLPNFPLPMYYGNTTLPVDIMFNESSVSFISVQNSSTMSIYQLNDPNSFGNRTVNISLLHPQDALPNNYTNGSIVLRTVESGIKYTLSDVLNQFGVPSKDVETLVQQVAPLLAEIAPAFFNMSTESNSTDPEPNAGIEKRVKIPKLPKVSMVKLPKLDEVGKKIDNAFKTPTAQNIIDKVKKEISNIGQSRAVCSVFASGALPGYLATARAAEIRAPGPGHTMTEDQMFFLYPLYKDYPLIADLRVHYHFPATSPEAKQFGAITFVRDMYMLAAEARFGPAWRTRLLNLRFREATRTLFHEVIHTQQYRNHGWSKESFGYEYLFQWCSSGYHYSKIRYEMDAAAQEQKWNFFLDDELGYAFFEFWKARNLKPILGYPTDTDSVPIPGGGQQWHEIEVQFQKGVLQHSQIGNCTRCFRVLDIEAVVWRQLSTMCSTGSIKADWCPIVHDLWLQNYIKEFVCLPELTRILHGDDCL